jgi:L-ascorbate metabolism protein UlaG (beta-lactamase superfamily)
MRLRYMGWAGVEIEHAGQTLIIDYIKDTYLLSIHEDFPSPLGGAQAALVTHLHGDHADPAAIAASIAKGAPVFRPEPNPGSGEDLLFTADTEAKFRQSGLEPIAVQPWQEHRVGSFRIIAAPAVDGLGDPQRTWVVECDGKRVLHAGDTMFHAYWWQIARHIGPINVAFLPINGPVLVLPHLQPPSPFHAAMLPEEAAVAAAMLHAGLAVPIHYRLIHNPPHYVEATDALERFSSKAIELGVKPYVPNVGEWFPVN